MNIGTIIALYYAWWKIVANEQLEKGRDDMVLDLLSQAHTFNR